MFWAWGWGHVSSSQNPESPNPTSRSTGGWDPPSGASERPTSVHDVSQSLGLIKCPLPGASLRGPASGPWPRPWAAQLSGSTPLDCPQSRREDGTDYGLGDQTSLGGAQNSQLERDSLHTQHHCSRARVGQGRSYLRTPHTETGSLSWGSGLGRPGKDPRERALRASHCTERPKI